MILNKPGLKYKTICSQPGEDNFPQDENGKTIFDTADFCATWEALEKCKDAGLSKSIGVSNFNHRQLKMILNKPRLKYKPVCNQVPKSEAEEATKRVIDAGLICTKMRRRLDWPSEARLQIAR
ncbi:aldo-keto reductase family 1 member C23-like protein [Tamandua tetradactyla]|uniref:aldo-keto reductase family 1 member C23-like protein n=1 Tax=Tamandua tetradactyla TaxID=48850 RepID=UPI004053C103